MREGRGKKKRRNKERREARKETGGRKEGGRGPFPKRLNSVPQVLGSIFVHQCPLPGSLLPAPMDTSHLEATPGDGPGEMNLVTLLDPLLLHCCPLLLHTCLGTLASVGHCHLPLVVFPFMCHHKQRRVLFLLQSMDSNILNGLFVPVSRFNPCYRD